MSAPANAERRNFYDKISAHHLTPLWEVLHALVPKQPSPSCVPAFWRYDDIAPYLEEAGRLITAKEAERRVLILENPAKRGQSCITNSLYAGLQLILPGEVAPAHRHTQSALRFIMRGRGAYTAVKGERAYMEPGDLILTPSWTWHDHGGAASEPVVWLDGLDIPTVSFYDAGFAEALNHDAQNVERPDGDAQARYGTNMLPVDYQPDSLSSPVFAYPFAEVRAALETMRRADEWDPCHGIKMKYINPVTGGHVMPTIAAFMQLLPKGFETRPYRSTDGAIFTCVEGEGVSRVGDQEFHWRKNDIFVVPSWCQVTHKATAESYLFSYSDRSAQEKLGLWREQRG